MKNLILLLTLFSMTSVWAIDDGTYILKTTALKSGYVITEGYQILNNRFRSLDVSINKKGIESAYFRGPTFRQKPSFIANSEYSIISKKTGLYTVYCKTQYGMANMDDESLVVKRWHLEKETVYGCPFSKKPSQRGLKNGKKNETSLIFTQKDRSVFLKFSPSDKPQKLIRIR